MGLRKSSHIRKKNLLHSLQAECQKCKRQAVLGLLKSGGCPRGCSRGRVGKDTPPLIDPSTSHQLVNYVPGICQGLLQRYHQLAVWEALPRWERGWGGGPVGWGARCWSGVGVGVVH